MKALLLTLIALALVHWYVRKPSGEPRVGYLGQDPNTGWGINVLDGGDCVDEWPVHDGRRA